MLDMGFEEDIKKIIAFMKFLKKIKLYKIVYKQILKFCHLEKMKSSIKMQKLLKSNNNVINININNIFNIENLNLNSHILNPISIGNKSSTNSINNKLLQLLLVLLVQPHVDFESYLY